MKFLIVPSDRIVPIRPKLFHIFDTQNWECPNRMHLQNVGRETWNEKTVHIRDSRLYQINVTFRFSLIKFAQNCLIATVAQNRYYVKIPRLLTRSQLPIVISCRCLPQSCKQTLSEGAINFCIWPIPINKPTFMFIRSNPAFFYIFFHLVVLYL